MNKLPTNPRRPTQKDVAKIAGVNRATVSLALRNHPGLPQSTKDKIRTIAEKIGYTPDPMLCALAYYRHNNRPHPFQGTMAWIVNEKKTNDWQKVAAFRPYFESSTSQAAKHGYKLEVFNLQSKEISKDRLASILRARNIRGLLLCPQPMPNTEIDFPWDHFSVVTFGYSLIRPNFHTVVSSQFRNTSLLARKLIELGYKRIGFVFSSFHDDRMDHNCLGGYLAEMTAHYGNYPLPPLRKSQITKKDFLTWYKKHKPDALLVGPNIPDIIEQCGINIPKDIGVACPLLHSEKSSLSGIFENPNQIGEVAVDYLASMIQRGETGIPASPRRILVEGTWHEGKTLRQKT